MIEFEVLVMQLNQDWHIFIQPIGVEHKFYKEVITGDIPTPKILARIREIIHAIRSRSR